MSDRHNWTEMDNVLRELMHGNKMLLARESFMEKEREDSQLWPDESLWIFHLFK